MGLIDWLIGYLGNGEKCLPGRIEITASAFLESLTKELRADEGKSEYEKKEDWE